MTRIIKPFLIFLLSVMVGCAGPSYKERPKETISTIGGAGIGGLLGSLVGGKLTIAAGAVIGALAGQEIGRGLDELDRLRAAQARADDLDRLRAAQARTPRGVYNQPEYRQPMYREPNGIRSTCRDQFYGSTTTTWRSPDYHRFGRLYDGRQYRHRGNNTGAIIAELADSFLPRTTRRSRESTNCSSETYVWNKQPSRGKF